MLMSLSLRSLRGEPRAGLCSSHRLALTLGQPDSRRHGQTVPPRARDPGLLADPTLGRVQGSGEGQLPTTRQKPELPAPSLLPPRHQQPCFLSHTGITPETSSSLLPGLTRTREPGGQLHHQRGPGGPSQGPCRSPAPTKHAQPSPPSSFHPSGSGPQISTSDTPPRKGRTKA